MDAIQSLILLIFIAIFANAKTQTLVEAMMKLSEEKILKQTKEFTIAVDYDKTVTVQIPHFYLDYRYGENPEDGEYLSTITDDEELAWIKRQGFDTPKPRVKNFVDLTDCSYLHLAVAKSFGNIIPHLIKPNRIDLEVRCRVQGNVYGLHDATPLLMAVYQGNHEMVSLLLSLGANPNVNTRNKLDPLLIASNCGDVQMVQLLVNGGALLDQEKRKFAFMKQGVDYVTHQSEPIHQACIEGHLEVVDYLLRKGVDIDQKASEGVGDTPLMAAAQSGRLEIVKFLIESGANANIRSNDGQRAIDVADMFGHNQIVEYLLEQSGASVPKRPTHELRQPGYIIKNPFVNRQPCYKVKDCYLCKTTKDIRKAYLNKPCVWVKEDGLGEVNPKEIPVEGEDPPQYTCQAKPYAEEHKLEIQDKCPGESKYAKQNCWKITKCETCKLSIDERPGLISPCVWIGGSKPFCTPSLTAHHREFPIWNTSCPEENPTPENVHQTKTQEENAAKGEDIITIKPEKIDL